MTTKLDRIDIHQADSRDLVVTVQDENGAAVDISSVASGAIKYHLSTEFSPEGEYPSAPYTLQLDNTSSADIEVTDGPNGVFKIHLKPADTEAVTPAQYYHACRIYVGGASYTLFTGQIRILKSLEMVHS